jgi:serine/threonine protein phosphatase PrpC
MDTGGTETFLRRIVARLCQHTEKFLSGTTLSIALVLEEQDEAVIAVLGDSPIVVIDQSERVHISPEHNVGANLTERQAAVGRGGMYQDGYILNEHGRGLQLSRALGDANFDGILSREPDIYTIKGPRWVLVGTDGLLDPAHYNTAALATGLAALRSKNVTARGIVDWAMARGLKDNATAVLWNPL